MCIQKDKYLRMISGGLNQGSCDVVYDVGQPDIWV